MNSYISGDIVYSIATPEERNLLKALQENNSMDGLISISMIKEPAWTRTRGIIKEDISVIARYKNKLVGMYSCSSFDLYYEGSIQRIRYLHTLRIQENFRHKIRFLKHGFASIEHLADMETMQPFLLTSIATDNKKAQRLLESNLKGMPAYIPLFKIKTLLFASSRGKWSGNYLPASTYDIDDIVSFYHEHAKEYDFAPVLSKELIESLDGTMGLRLEDFYISRDHKGAIRGMFAVWDQRASKKIFVDRYKKALRYLRIPYNLYAYFTHIITLPREHKQIPQIFISYLMTDKMDTDDLLEALEEAAYIIRQRGATVCVTGFPTDFPSLDLLHKRFSPNTYETQIEAVFLDPSARIPVQFSNPKPEVALL